FKISLQVPVGKAQELSAEFFLEGLDEKVSAKQSFQVAKQDEVVNVQFQPKLGALKVKALPRAGDLYLEGKFEGEKSPAKSIQIEDIALDVPIYLPHGKYVAEIRVPQRLDGTESTVRQVKFRREFELGEAKGEFVLNAPDESLSTFPAVIKTQPDGAELYVDGKKLGVTPFTGNIPMGRHKLVLKKEGFSDYEKEISIEINTPYEANYNLETTPAGVYVNEGRKLLKKGQYNAAIEKLAEALKANPEAVERGQIHMLLGEAFLQSKTYDQALAYYQKAAESPENAKKARLGVAEAHAGLGNKAQALIEVVDVFLKTEDKQLKSQAASTYKRISPMKSVLYVTSEPVGAQVTINGNPISQATPVILSDLMVGSYRVGVSKPGFKNFETRVTLPISAIKPVIVKLEAEQ
ncbi:MAG: PEGA domain-containing protein, partial [bacterium]|nr:PEGA domain-containing protein [bacterium]